MEEQKARPPYVTFEIRSVEDREATIATGRYTAKDDDFAIVTPAGSKDRIERNVREWFEQLEVSVQQERFPREWLANYQAKYKAFKEGREMPLDGTAIINWPAVSPAQVRALLDAGCRTVEDLASANEEMIGRLGMGGRALKDRAKAFLEAAAGPGKLSEEVAGLRQENLDLKSTNESMQLQLTKLAQQVEALSRTTA